MRYSLLITVILGSFLYSANNLHSARPYSVDDPFPVDEGVVEFETGVEFKISSAGPWYRAPYYFSLRSGLSSRFDLAMAFSVEPSAGPLELQSKIILFKKEPWYLSMTISWGKDYDVPALNFIGGWCPEMGNFYYNSGYTPGEEVFQGVTFQKEVSNFLFGAEVTYLRTLDDNKNHFSTLLGINYFPVDNLSLDVGIGWSISENSFSITTGVVWDM